MNQLEKDLRELEELRGAGQEAPAHHLEEGESLAIDDSGVHVVKVVTVYVNG